MQKTPCEHLKWQGLPIIRKELVKSMIKNHDMTQKEIAKRMGLTPAAVCQYLSRKRSKMSIIDASILNEIDISAEKIIKNGESSVTFEICRICNILKDHNILSFSNLE